MVKNLFRKIKFMFTGRDNQKYVFNNDSQISEKEIADLELVKARRIALERAVKDYRIKVRLGYEKQRFYVLRSYGKDKAPLIRILIRTRKPRIKKKLIKRIVN